MRPICQSYQALNEQTTPLTGMPYYCSTGLIKAWTKDNMEYAVAFVTLERFDEQNFQYVFTPIWAVIDALPPNIFQGIPGIDLDLRLEKYYRVNMTPVFIAERTPGKTREDLWELLASVGLDYYDRFEWLLRTDMRYSSDNLIVRRLPDQGRSYRLADIHSIDPVKQLTCSDRIILDSLQSLSAASPRKLSRDFMVMLSSGAAIYVEEDRRCLSDEERYAMLRLLILQKQAQQAEYQQKRSDGIAQAKRRGKYTGRKRIEIDSHLMDEIDAQLRSKQITVSEAMTRLGLSSRATFYRRLREYRAENKNVE